MSKVRMKTEKTFRSRIQTRIDKISESKTAMKMKETLRNGMTFAKSLGNRMRMRIEKMHMSGRKWIKKEYASVFFAVLAVIVVSVTAVLVVRALLTDYTNMRVNIFSPMTYTNIEIVEDPPAGGYSVVLSSSTTGNEKNNGYITKDAEIRNITGGDKKPVYLRAKIIMTIYDSDGNNISALLSTGSAPVQLDENSATQIDTANWYKDGTNWTKKSDGYYYYNRILLPGDSTEKLFDTSGDLSERIRILNARRIPNGSVVHIDILADAVQAVSTDKSIWTTDDYYSSQSEVTTAWGFAPTLPSQEGTYSYFRNGSWVDSTWNDVKDEQVSIGCSW